MRTPAQTKMLEQFRARVDGLRNDLRAVEAQVGPDLKRMLVGAHHLLQDAERLTLDPKIIGEPRTDAQLVEWLAFGERIVRGAEVQIAEVANVLRDFGPNARLVG